MPANKKTIQYWEKRFEDILIANEKLGLDFEKELAKIYAQTKLDVENQLESFYNRYAKETGISLAEARKRLNGSQLKKFKTQQQIYLDKVEELISRGANLENYAKRLKLLSGRAYVSRLQEIQNNLNTLITILNAEQELRMGDVLKSSYLQGYTETMFVLQKGLGIGMSFNIPDNDAVLKVLRTPWNGNNYSSSIWSNKQKLTDWLNTDLPRHMASGSSIERISKDLSKKLDVSYNNAVRLVRTEVNYISNQSSMDSYKSSGVVEKYQILATLDDRTSDICRDMDGKIFDVKESKVGVNTPPFHVRCRTTTVPYFEDEDYSDLERIARGSDGKTYHVPADMTYNEWLKKYGK